MRKYVMYLMVLLGILSCNYRKESSEQNERTKESKSSITTKITPETFDSHTSQNSLDWEGSYSGVLPCSNCEGIDTRLTLRKNHTYQLVLRYLGIPGEQSQDVISEGEFLWGADGSTILLEHEKLDFQKFKVGELFLVPLDKNGNIIQGVPGNNYKLIKA